MYEFFDHTADLGLRVVAPDLEALLVEAAEGLFSIVADGVERGGPAARRAFLVPGQAQRPDWLLLDWLNELLCVFDTERVLLFDFEVRLVPSGLEATAGFRPLAPSDRLLHEVKAITYHALKVERRDDRWCAELVLDI